MVSQCGVIICSTILILTFYRLGPGKNKLHQHGECVEWTSEMISQISVCSGSRRSRRKMVLRYQSFLFLDTWVLTTTQQILSLFLWQYETSEEDPLTSWLAKMNRWSQVFYGSNMTKMSSWRSVLRHRSETPSLLMTRSAVILLCNLSFSQDYKARCMTPPNHCSFDKCRLRRLKVIPFTILTTMQRELKNPLRYQNSRYSSFSWYNLRNRLQLWLSIHSSINSSGRPMSQTATNARLGIMPVS